MKKYIALSMLFLPLYLYAMNGETVAPDIVINITDVPSEDTMDLSAVKSSFLLHVQNTKSRSSSSDRRLYRDAIKTFFNSNDPDLLDLVEPHLQALVQEELESPVNIFKQLQSSEDSQDQMEDILYTLITQSIIKAFQNGKQESETHRRTAQVSSRRMCYAIVIAVLTTITTVGTTITAIVTNTTTA